MVPTSLPFRFDIRLIHFKENKQTAMRRRISVSKYETSVVDVCPAERESVYRG